MGMGGSGNVKSHSRSSLICIFNDTLRKCETVAETVDEKFVSKVLRPMFSLLVFCLIKV